MKALREMTVIQWLLLVVVLILIFEILWCCILPCCRHWKLYCVFRRRQARRRTVDFVYPEPPVVQQVDADLLGKQLVDALPRCHTSTYG